MFFSKTFAITTLFAAAAVAAPTYTDECSNPPPAGEQPPVPSSTTPEVPSTTVHLTGVTHSVTAGLGGLRFEPDNIVAEVGDVVEWHFLPANHSVVQSSFDKPCEPLADGTGFFSGFNFATQQGQSDNVFQIVVEDRKPIWFYCSQTNGNHCQKGMNGVVNQNFDNQAFSLRAHRELAAKTTVSVSPPVVQGGEVLVNPNPLSGF
jgi:plastocyanin